MLPVPPSKPVSSMAKTGELYRSLNVQTSTEKYSARDLQQLYDCPYTGAVTTRTTLLDGFPDNPTMHQHAFFENGNTSVHLEPVSHNAPSLSTLNTYGYSPLPLKSYLSIISDLAGQGQAKKPFIISVTGSPSELAKAYQRISTFAFHHSHIKLAMEVNLSCPNIANKPPPAYNLETFKEYLEPVAMAKVSTYTSSDLVTVPVGVKLPPYTYMGQFQMALQAIKESKGDQYTSKDTVIDFITTTNTLGSSLLLDEGGSAALASEAGTGIGGLAGAAIHPLSLGNVATFRRLFDADPQTKDIYIIGVGGVEDAAGYARMRAAGAGAVACASALGRYGVDVFRRISEF